MSTMTKSAPAPAFRANGSLRTSKSFKMMPFAERFNKLQIPASGFTVRTHPMTDQISETVNKYFYDNWSFPTKEDREKFLGADFSRFCCYLFPCSMEDRLRHVCEIVTHLFLIDDILEEKTLDEGKALNDKLTLLARGDILPDRNFPPEWMMYDIWQNLRKCDEELANAMVQPCSNFMHAQTDPRRLIKMNLESYLDYRLDDVGKEFLSAMICFTRGIHLTEEEFALVDAVDKNAARHISVINDIWSYDKEMKAVRLGNEGSTMTNAVDVLADEASMPIESAKRVLYRLCREWEIVHDTLVAEILEKRESPALRIYLKDNEYQMSGNEGWSRVTFRYSVAP